MHWSGFTGDSLKVAEILVKLRFPEEITKYIVGDGLDSWEKLEHLDVNMCNSLIQKYRQPGADHKGVAVSMMAEVFLKILVWGLEHINFVSRKIYFDTIDIEWCCYMNNQKKLDAAWPNTLS